MLHREQLANGTTRDRQSPPILETSRIPGNLGTRRITLTLVATLNIIISTVYLDRALNFRLVARDKTLELPPGDRINTNRIQDRRN